MNVKKALIFVIAAIMVLSAGVVGAQDVAGQETDPRHPPRPQVQRPAARMLRELVNIIAEETGLEPQEIVQQMRAGMTPAAIITANGGDVDAVVTEAVAIVTERVNQALEGGTITQERADNLLANLEERITQALNGELRIRAPQNRPQLPRRQRPRQQALRHVGRAVVEQTGLTPAEIREQLQSGDSLADILTENGVSVDAFAGEVLTPLETRLEQAVERGRITQEQADERLQNARERLSELLNRSRAET